MEENELPIGWVWTDLQRIAVYGPQNGLYLPQSAYGQGIPILRIDDFQNGTSRSSSGLRLVDASKEDIARYSLQLNDLVINRVNSPSHLGKCLLIAERNLPALFESNMMLIRLSKEVYTKFAAFYFHSNEGRSRLISNAKWAVNQASINQDDVNKTSISLPPLAEQQRIVAAIEQQFTRLDAGVAALKSAQKHLKRYRAAVLKAAVEGKLTEAWRAEHPSSEPASVLLERILVERRAKWETKQLLKMQANDVTPKDDNWKRAYKEPVKPSRTQELKFPVEWEWVTLKTIADVQLGKMLSPKAYETGLVQLPYLRNENVRWGLIDYTDVKNMGFKEQELEKYSLEPNDLLVCEGGEAGRCAIYTTKSKQYMYQKALHRVRVINNLTLPQFIQFCIQHYVASKIIVPKPSETTIQHLPLEKMEVLPFPLPPLEEQQQIVAEVERRFSIVSQLEAIVDANLKRAERMRQSILKEAFAGRLVPQDPDDEPASVLLERIRQEREAQSERKQGKEQNRQGNGKKAREKGNPKRQYVTDMVDQEPEPIDSSELEQVALWNGVTD